MIALSFGFILDLMFGDPSFMPHPVRLMGKVIEKGEDFLRGVFPVTRNGQLLAGTLLSVFLMLSSFGLSWLLLWGAGQIHPLLPFLMESVMCYQILAVKALKVESMKVYQALVLGDLTAARQAVSMIVGRDTQNLDAEGIAKAAVETVAENTADGIIAPLFFMVLGGAPLGFLYKAINTLDSMIGYQNQRYLYFGRFAARADDVAGFIPARISALLMILASFFLRLDGKNAIRIFKRDRFNHKSPNSAQTEAVCAGALRVALAGDAYYFGTLCEKETIGDKERPIEAEDIKRANDLLYLTAILGLAAGFGLRLVLEGLLMG